LKRPSPTNDKPILDEASFQQLLSAAFVLQRHTERQLSGVEPETGYSKTLATILEIQEQVRSRRLDLRATAVMIARRVREISTASGSAVGVVEGDHLQYYAASGSASSESGARLAFDSSLAEECLRTGEVHQSADAEIDPLLNPELCRTLHVRAFLAAPILFEGRVAGVLELHFPQVNSVQEHDIRTCQVLAALLADVLARDERGETEPTNQDAPKKSSADRAAMLAALERIKPQLERLVRPPAVPATPEPIPQSAPEATPTPEGPEVCSDCAHRLGKDESSCGVCGAARPAEDIPTGVNPTASPWSSLWEMQRTAERTASTDPIHRPTAVQTEEHDPLEVLPSEMEKVVAHFAHHPGETDPSKMPRMSYEAALASAPERVQSTALSASLASPAEAELPLPAFTSEAELSGKPEHSPNQDPDNYAAFSADMEADELVQAPLLNTPGDLLEEERSAGSSLAQKWQAHRAHIYLGASVLLLIAVLAGWGTPNVPTANSGGGASATAQPRKAPPQPELTLFDRMLIGLGLAEAPTAPVYMGKPDIRVWIDTHTALYYCPGSELYGKTPGGRFTTQGDAQQDQFEPASRRVCD
jgi:hypothetical protein